MKEKEFNLSEFRVMHSEFSQPLYLEEDLKEAVKKLKEKSKKGMGFCGDELYFLELINEIFGDKLI